MSWIMLFLRTEWFSYLCSVCDMIPQNSLYHRSIQAFSRARTGFPVRWKSLFRNIGKPFYRLCVCNMLMSNGLRFCFISLCTCRCSVVRCLLHDSQSLDVIRIFLLIPPYCACFDLIPVHGIYHLFISDFEIRFLLFCVCAVAVWIKNITCANAHLLQSTKNSLILNLSSYRKNCLLTCLPVLHFSSDMLPPSFLPLLYDGVRHIHRQRRKSICMIAARNTNEVWCRDFG